MARYTAHNVIRPDEALCGASPTPPPPDLAEGDVELCPRCLAIETGAEMPIELSVETDPNEPV